MGEAMFSSTSVKASWGTQIGCILLGYCIFLTSFTLIKTMGIFFIQFQGDFDASAAQVSFTVSLPSLAVFIGGPAYGAVFNAIGIKPTYALAGTLIFIGFGGCFFAPTLLLVQVFLGLFFGIGAGLSNVATLTLLGRAFYSSRPLALGALAMGGSTAAAIGGPVLQWCIDKYSWRGAILLLAAYSLHCIAFGIAIEPIYSEIVRKRQRALMLRVLSSAPSFEKPPQEESSTIGLPSECDKDDDEVFETSIVTYNSKGEPRPSNPFLPPRNSLRRRKSSVYDRFATLGTTFASAFDLSLLKNPWFVCFCLSCGLSICSRILTGLYLVRYVQAAGISDQNAAMKLTVCESVAFVMTPIVALVTSVKRETSRREESKAIRLARRVFSSVRRSFVLSFFQILMSVVIWISTTFETNEQFNYYAAMLGFCYGGITSSTNVVLADLFGTKRLAGAVGYRSLAAAVMFLLTPPLVGHLIDVTGTYNVAQYFLGAMTLIAGLLTSLTQVALLYKERTENNNNRVIFDS